MKPQLLCLIELKDSLSRVGSDLKQKIIDSVKSTWRTINDLAHYRRTAGDEVPAAAVPGYTDGDLDIDNIIPDSAAYYSEPSGRTWRLRLLLLLFFCWRAFNSVVRVKTILIMFGSQHFFAHCWSTAFNNLMYCPHLLDKCNFLWNSI